MLYHAIEMKKMKLISIITAEGACFIPTELPDKLGLFYDSAPHNEITKGSYASPLADVIYKCKDNYTLNGITKNVCFNGNWAVPTHPQCIKFCPPLFGISINVTCLIQNETISCRQPHIPGTIANIKCAYGYRKPVNGSGDDVLRCGEDGEWDFPTYQCEQICGVEGKRIE